MKINSRILKLVLVFISISTLSCSDDYLDEVTYGEVAPDEMTNPDNVERAIISAYSVLNGQFDGASNAYNSPASNWSFGDVISDDAYKGGGGTGDQNNIHQMEIFNTNPTTLDIERKWMALYEGVKRVNEAMRLLAASEDFDENLRIQREAELRFLRGHYYFELKKIYNHIPYIDETAAEVKDYIRFIADRRLSQLGLQPIFRIEKNPLPWLDEILNGVEHANFFENRATEYSKAATLGSWDEVWDS